MVIIIQLTNPAKTKTTEINSPNVISKGSFKVSSGNDLNATVILPKNMIIIPIIQIP